MSDKKLWNTIIIKLPKEMVNITKSGKIKIKAPLTKKGNIAKLENQPSIQLKIANIDDPEIINKGKKWNITELKDVLKKTELIKKKTGERKIKEIINKMKSKKKTYNKKEILEANIKFLKIVDDILNVKSPYTYSKNKEKYQENIINIIKSISKDEDKIFFNQNFAELIVNAEKNNDFYPTPEKIINKFETNIKEAENILEPCAGLGHILTYIRKVNSKANITFNEYYPQFREILIKMNPDLNYLKENNFLEYFPENNINYDTIIINPPFSQGGDKRYYLDFLFHCLFIMRKTNINSQNVYFPTILLISPNIAEKNNDEIEFENVLKFLSKKKKNDIFKRYKNYYDNEEEFFNDIEPFKILFKGNESGFTNTSINVNLYEILCFRRT